MALATGRAKKKPAQGGLNNQLKKAPYSRASTVYEFAAPARIRGIPLPARQSGLLARSSARRCALRLACMKTIFEVRGKTRPAASRQRALRPPRATLRRPAANARELPRTWRPPPRASVPHACGAHRTAHAASRARRGCHGAGPACDA